MVKEQKNKWKAVKLDGAFAANDIEGLVGIEELNDYDLNSVLENKKNKSKKRKISEIQPEKKKSKLNEIKHGENIIQPGTFVRNPHYIPKKKSGKKKTGKKIKIKTEIGQNVDKNSKEKCSLDDLKAWSIVSLPEPILQGLADVGFTKPTPIQELTLPAAIFGRRDILGAAETGSGKTLAFGLPILTGILKQKEKDANLRYDDGTEFIDDENHESEDELEENFNMEEDNEYGLGCVKSIDNMKFDDVFENKKSLKPLYALILTPTRELAIQIKNHLIAAAKYTGIRVAVVLGGMAAVKQERILSKCPEIVVATPGRLWELYETGNPHLSQIDNIKFLAIDETDRMIEKYHFEELNHILERINMDEEKRKQRQNFVFSATLTMVHDLPRYLQKKRKLYKNSRIHKLTSEEKLKNIIDILGITNPKIVDVTKDTAGTAKTLTECRINCLIEEKDYYIYYFLKKYPGRTLIFCNSIGCVKRLASLLSMLECPALPLHASMQQRQRLKNLEKFRDNDNGILIATDVAARGLDIPSVEHVLHYQTPRTSESYVHRSGRTARACKEGLTVLLIEPNEVMSYVKMCATLGRSEDLPHFPIVENILAAVKRRVNLARKLEKLELQTKRTNSETGWLHKAASEMDIIIDDKEFSLEDDKEENAIIKRQINGARQELKTLLAKPLFPKGFSVNYPTSVGQMDIPFVQGDQKIEKAVHVMKTHIENSAKNKNKPKRLFKRHLLKKTENTKMETKNLNRVFKNKQNKKFKK